MRIFCWQTILMKYHTLFLSKIREEVAIFVVCCSRDWRFKGLLNSSKVGSCHNYVLFLALVYKIIFTLPNTCVSKNPPLSNTGTKSGL